MDFIPENTISQNILTFSNHKVRLDRINNNTINKNDEYLLTQASYVYLYDLQVAYIKKFAILKDSLALI